MNATATKTHKRQGATVIASEPTRTIKLNAWEIAAIERALGWYADGGHLEAISAVKLIQKIDQATEIVVTVPDYSSSEESRPIDA